MSIPKQKSVDETDYPENQRTLLGQGTYGIVYRVTQPGKPSICVKYLRPSNDADFEEAFLKECDTLRQLQHMNIVQYYHKIWIPEQRLFGIVTEYCEKGTLKNVIMNPTINYTIWTLVDWSESLFRALKYLHEIHTILHRDIKPSK